MAITILDYVKTVAGEKDTYTAEDFWRAGVGMIGGCQDCEATIAPYNAYPSTSGYWRCANCIGTSGYATVEAFLASCAEADTGLTEDPDDIGLVSLTCPGCGGVEHIRQADDHTFECDDCGSVWHR